jgi:hypothetical protein
MFFTRVFEDRLKWQYRSVESLPVVERKRRHSFHSWRQQLSPSRCSFDRGVCIRSSTDCWRSWSSRPSPFCLRTRGAPARAVWTPRVFKAAAPIARSEGARSAGCQDVQPRQPPAFAAHQKKAPPFRAGLSSMSLNRPQRPKSPKVPKVFDQALVVEQPILARAPAAEP